MAYTDTDGSNKILAAGMVGRLPIPLPPATPPVPAVSTVLTQAHRWAGFAQEALTVASIAAADFPHACARPHIRRCHRGA